MSMKSKSLRVVFMGTPEFAVRNLAEIHLSHHKVVGVITVADKPAGRGKKLRNSAVKDYALTEGLSLFQPTRLKDPEFLQELKELQADVFVVVAFRMLPKEVWRLPKLGTFNLHASLLPNYRGAAPIHWAIINGEKETGVTTFLIDEKIDTGEILLQERTKIGDKETTGELHNRLADMGKRLIIQTLDQLSKGKLSGAKQKNNQEVKDAPKLFPDSCLIDWSDSPKNIYNKIRGLNPFPVAFTKIKINEQEKILKIFSGKIEKIDHELPLGTIVSTKKELKIAIKNGFYLISDLKLEGKKRMNTLDFMNGKPKISEIASK